MPPSQLQHSSSDLFEPSASFENALAAIDLPELKDPPSVGTSKRKVAFRETPDLKDAEIESFGEDEERPAKRPRLDDEATRSISDHAPDDKPMRSIDETDDDGDDDEFESITEADRLAYLEDKAYSASTFGGIRSYLRNRRVKLQNQNQDIANARGSGKPKIFNGLAIYINGYVKPSLQQMKEMLMEHGAIYHPFLDRKKMVTHIVATTLTPAKHLEFRTYRVVHPQWILDSVAAGELKDWRDYKLLPEGGYEENGRKGLGGWLGSQKGKHEKAGEESARGRKRSDLGTSSSTGTMGAKAEASPKQTLLQPRPLAPPITPARGIHSSIAAASSPFTRTAPPFEDAPTPTHAQLSVTPASKPQPEHSVYAPLKARSPPQTSDPATFAMYQRSGYALEQEHPDAKRLMKSNEWRVANTAAAGEGFIEGYYNNSRLHMLSMWKAELKVLVAKAQDQAESPELIKSLAPGVQDASHSLSTSVLPKASPRKANFAINSKTATRVIMHVDFDAFFVSCGLATRPELRGKPVVVCHSQGRQGAAGSTSEVASCSYEAREKGVKNGMSLGQARRLCADVQTIPYEFETYKTNSLSFYTILMAYADELQAISVDEAILDVTSQVAALAAAPDSGEREQDIDMDVGAELDAAMDGEERGKDWALVLAERIREDVRKATSCEVSIGIAHNLLLARLATRKAKPAGAFHLRAFAAPAFLSHLDIGDLPGYGYATRDKINETFGSTLCGDLLKHPKSLLRAKLGDKTGETLYGYLRGVDEKVLEPHKERKSVSAEVNYGIRFISTEEAEEFLVNLSKEVAKRMQAVQRKAKLMTLKIMTRHPDAPLETPKFMGHGVCITTNKSAPIGKNGKATDDPVLIAESVLKVYRSSNFDATELRGIGIQVQKLEGGDEKVVEAGQSLLGFAKKSILAVEPTVEATVDPLFISPDATPPESPGHPPCAQAPLLNPANDGPLPVSPPLPPPTRAVVDPGIMPPTEMDATIWSVYLTQADRNDMRMKWRKAKMSVPQQLLSEPPKACLDASMSKDQNHARTRSESAGPSKQKGKQIKLKGFKVLSKTPGPEEPIDVDLEDDVFQDHAESVKARPIEKASKARMALTKKGRELGIAESYLGELPMDLLRETIDAETARVLLSKPKPALKRRSKSPVKKAIVPVIPIDKALRPLIKGQAVTMEDILANIQDLAGREDSPEERRNQRSVAKLQDYLLECMDHKKGGVGGVEDVVTALRWWKACLKRKWAVGSEGDVGEAKARRAKEWQTVFRGVREAVDRAAIVRFGGPLAIS